MPDSVTYADFKSVQFRLICKHSQHLVYSKKHHYVTPPLGKETSSFCVLKEGNVVFNTEDGIVTGSAGDFFYVPAGIHYRSDWTGSPKIEFLNIHFRFVGSQIQEKLLNPNQVARPLDQQIAFQRIDALCDFKMTELMESLLPYDRHIPVEQLSLLSLLYQIFSLAYPHLKMRKKAKKLDAIEPAVSYIDANYTQCDPVSLYADLCHLSESRFHHLFRVRQASYLLSETMQSIEQISSTIGFESSIYFRRVFKYFYGMSPSMFRKRVQA